MVYAALQRCGSHTPHQILWTLRHNILSPQHHGTHSVCWRPGRVRLTVEESDRRSSTAPPTETLVQSTQEHHLKKQQGSVRGNRRLLVPTPCESYSNCLSVFPLDLRLDEINKRRNQRGSREENSSCSFVTFSISHEYCRTEEAW